MSSTLPPQSAATTTTTDDSWTSLATTITSTISWHIAETAKIMNTPTTLMQDDRIISTAIRDTTTTTTTSTSTTTPTHTVITSTTAVPVTSKSRLNVADLSASLQRFGIVDYLVFAIMLVVCALIGFYFGFIERKQKQKSTSNRRDSEALNYLVGGRKMKVVPVSISLVASFISGISLLGTSTEVYVYGTQYAFILVTTIFSGIISWYVFLPVFCNLQLTSTYEYLELRFDKSIRLMGSIFFTISTVLWLPIVIYVPALAFNQVTGINIHVVTPAVCVVCIFYTCVGGLKAVVWTDVLQTVIMVGTILFISIKGTTDVGGLQVVWQRGWDSGRIELPTLTMDPTVRASMFSIFFGTTAYTLQVSAGNQNLVQRYLALPGPREVGQALTLFTIGNVLLSGVCFYNGLLIYANYHDCDPLTTKLANAKDQLVPLYVMDLLGQYPGVPGLFVAAVFSAAMSSLSTGLNSLCAVVLEDFIKPIYRTPLTESQTAIIMRATVVIIGLVAVALVFVVEKLGTVLQLSMTLGSITMGPLLGLFLIGLLLPWINAKSALIGCSTSFCLMVWICGNAQWAIANKELVYDTKPVSIENCGYNFEENLLNSTVTAITTKTLSERSFLECLFHMSFMFYVSVGCCLTIIFSFLAAFRYGFNDPNEMNINLFPFFLRKYLKPKHYSSAFIEEKISMLDIRSTEE